MNEIIYKQSPMGELLDADEKAGIVKGYASTFGNKDSDNDIINKGAYKNLAQTLNTSIISLLSFPKPHL